nr:PLP-dependent aminotransferase family protein [Pseudenhygromyxa sp. WMMC2535]
MTSQGGRFVQSATPPGVINFGLGQPSPRLLPLATIAEAAQAQLSATASRLVLQYGTLAGTADFRASLAAFLRAGYGQPVDADELLITAGISSALSLACEVFARPGGLVVCEDPTYFLARGIFESAGLRLTGVGVDERGLDVDALAARLAAGLRPDLLYCIPSFQNPSGVSLAPERARRLIELAEAFDFTIIADEPYALLHYGPSGPGSLAGFEAALHAGVDSDLKSDVDSGRVLSLGSFSKILAPGLRLGWAQGSPALIERLSWHGALRSGGGLNPVIAHIVHHTLESGFLPGHVASLRETFAGRAQALTAALRGALPGLELQAPEGGYFLWLDLGERLQLAEGSPHAAALEAAEVRVIPGQRCALDRDLSRFVRLSVSFYEAGELEEGARRLAAGLHAARRTTSPNE